MEDPKPGSSISLPLSTSGWDDRELVNAYDAALLEFHIHNPGPGSWLDKATAALAKGQPLPGANDFGTDWYAAAKRVADAEAAAGPKKYAVPHQPRKKARISQSNPYATEAAEATESPLSPTYVPASPGAEDVDGDGDGEAVVEDEANGDIDVDLDGDAEAEAEADLEGDGEEYEYDPMPEWDGQVSYAPGPSAGPSGPSGPSSGPSASFGASDPFVFPPPSGDWPAAVSRDAALGYALHAQYWAGYWMGVARGAGRGQPGTGAGKRKRKGTVVVAGSGAGSGSGASGSGSGNGAQPSAPSWARGNGVSGLRR